MQKKSKERPTAAIVVIGNEILSGRTQDVNVQFIARQLVSLGIRLAEVGIIPDCEEMIVTVVNRYRSCYDYIFTTGGIGPTHDDITSQAIAKAFGVELCRNQEAEKILRAHYAGTETELNRARLKMADIPKGAMLIENPVSKAPGFQLENVFVLAGVPVIVQSMFAALRERLREGPSIYSKSLFAFVPEGELAAGLEHIQERFLEVEIGSYPFFRGGRVGASVVMRGIDPKIIETVAALVSDLMEGCGGSPETGDS